MDFEMIALDFSGHGARAGEETADFSIEQFAQDVIAWMDREEISQLDIFGYSMGGYVALWLAAKHPERVGKIMALATKFAWSSEAAEKEAKMLDPAKTEEKVPAFAAQLAQLHGPGNWRKVMENTALMMQSLGNKPLLTPELLSGIAQPVQVMVGDRDNMVTLDETVNVFKQLPNARLSVLPDSKHPLERIALNRLKFEVKSFFT